MKDETDEISKLCITGLEGNSLVTGEFPSQRASNAENISIGWRHHGIAFCGWNNLYLENSTFKHGSLESFQLYIITNTEHMLEFTPQDLTENMSSLVQLMV